MYTTYNDEDSVKKRLYGDRLVLSGRALIILGIWSSIKAIIIFYLALPQILEFVHEGDVAQEENVRIIKLFSMAIFVVIVAIVFLFHLFIGRSAMKNGYGKKRTTFYLVLTVLVIISTIASDVQIVMEGFDIIDLASMVVDLTVVYACCDILYSAIKLRTIEKKTEERV